MLLPSRTSAEKQVVVANPAHLPWPLLEGRQKAGSASLMKKQRAGPPLRFWDGVCGFSKANGYFVGLQRILLLMCFHSWCKSEWFSVALLLLVLLSCVARCLIFYDVEIGDDNLRNLQPPSAESLSLRTAITYYEPHPPLILSSLNPQYHAVPHCLSHSSEQYELKCHHSTATLPGARQRGYDVWDAFKQKAVLPTLLRSRQIWFSTPLRGGSYIPKCEVLGELEEANTTPLHG